MDRRTDALRTRPATRRSVVRRRKLALESLEGRLVLSAMTYVVTTALDDPYSPIYGLTTLRDAITESNANAGAWTNTIDFKISGLGVQTINLEAALPLLTQSALIDGTSQPGYLAAPSGISMPEIEVRPDPAVASSIGGFNGLDLSAGQTTIQGLSMGGFGTAITIESQGGVTVRQDYLGVAPDGLSTFSNTGTDIFDRGGNQNNILDDVISGAGTGVFVATSGSKAKVGDLIAGNFIGTDATGTVAVPDGIGLNLEDVGFSTIGGTTAADRNVISGNSTVGIKLANVDATLSAVTMTSNLILGNFIGTDVSGTKPLGNTTGILVEGAAYSTIGDNVISGNSGSGIELAGTDVSGNLSPVTATAILGNFIGTDATGSNALGNGTGILDESGGSDTIGGTGAGARNVISGNTSAGIDVAGVDVSGSDVTTTNDTINGNYIGIDVTGTKALGNATGILVETASLTTIGDNVISGNSASGIEMFDLNLTSQLFPVTDTTILGNFIGTDATGTKPLGNGAGILDESGGGDTIGGTLPGARNVISGNASVGIEVAGVDVSGSDVTNTSNSILGNFIGTDATGTTAMGNGTGVSIAGASLTTIGNNLISGNASSGVELSYMDLSGDFFPVTDSTILGNFIGTDISGSKAVSNGVGILDESAGSNTIGGTETGAGNVISGNYSAGIQIGGVDPSGSSILASGDMVLGNFIGTDVSGTLPIGNAVGVDIVDGNDNIIGNLSPSAPLPAGSNVIAYNLAQGVQILAGTNNAIRGNSILANGGPGILLAPRTNGGVAAPTLTSVEILPQGTSLTGSVTGPAGVYLVDVYANTAPLATGLVAQGQTLLGSFSVSNDAAGTTNFSVSEPFAAPAGSSITLTSTYATGGKSAGFNTSAFSNAVTALDTYTVTNTNDSGPGSLRQVITNVENSASTGSYTISFNIPGAGPHVIAVNSPLPSLSRTITIDGTTQPGSSQNTLADGDNATIPIVIDGSQASRASTTVVSGLNLVAVPLASFAFAAAHVREAAVATSTTDIIKGLDIVGFSGAAITVGSGAAGSLIAGNFLGFEPNTTNSPGNGIGIFVNNSSDTIGGTTSADRNVISNNLGDGIDIVATQGTAFGTQVEGNYVGTDTTGAHALANQESGIELSGAAQNNTIGGTAAGSGNVVSGNGILHQADLTDGAPLSGVVLNGALAVGNQILGNKIGTDPTGLLKVPNLFDGVSIYNSAFNIVAGNEISGNGGVVTSQAIGLLPDPSNPLNSAAMVQESAGINVQGTAAAGNVLAGNAIGTDPTGTVVVGNSLHGIAIGNGATSNTVGGLEAFANLSSGVVGTTSLRGNLISGNGNAVYQGAGVFIYDGLTANQTLIPTSGNVVEGNRIGTDGQGGALSNTGGAGATVGVYVAASKNTIGGTAAGAGNVISGNSSIGVELANGFSLANARFAADSNVVQGNTIGTDATGSTAVPNGLDGVFLNGANNNTIGGTTAGSGNVIAGNGQFGIQFSGGGSIGPLNFGTGEAGNVVVGNSLGVIPGTGKVIPNVAADLLINDAPGTNTISLVQTAPPVRVFPLDLATTSTATTTNKSTIKSVSSIATHNAKSHPSGPHASKVKKAAHPVAKAHVVKKASAGRLPKAAVRKV